MIKECSLSDDDISILLLSVSRVIIRYKKYRRENEQVWEKIREKKSKYKKSKSGIIASGETYGDAGEITRQHKFEPREGQISIEILWRFVHLHQNSQM